MKVISWTKLLEYTPNTDNLLEVYTGELGAEGYYQTYIYYDEIANIFYKLFKRDPSERATWFIGVT